MHADQHQRAIHHDCSALSLAVVEVAKEGRQQDRTERQDGRDIARQLRIDIVFVDFITKNGKTETLILKDVPIFPLPGYVHLAVLVLLFLALILYTNVILYPNKFKERIMEVRNTYEKIRCFNSK